MIYELRTYEVLPGRMPALHERFANTTVKFFEKHGIKVIGFWNQEIGVSNEFVYMIAFDSLAHREKAWGAFQNDPEWVKARAESERETGPFSTRNSNKILRPTPYSPLQ